MGKIRITDFVTYRWRYQIGYTIIGLAFITLLTFATLYIPGGLSTDEIKRVAAAPALAVSHPETLAIPSAPYYAFQKAAFHFLGVTNFSVKVVSLIIAVATGLGAVLLLRQWYRSNVAVLATAIMVTTAQFLYVAQAGTSSITYIFWPIWLLLTGIMITRAQRFRAFWKILFFILIPLSLYTPLSIYLVVAILSSVILHPHVRHAFKRLSIWQKLGLGLLGILELVPLGYLIWLNPALIWRLLGAPAEWPPDIMANLATIANDYIGLSAPVENPLMTPFIGIASALLMALGIVRLIQTRYSARSYTITAWLILLIPVIIINPSFTTVTFVPLLLLLASGVDLLLRSWYDLFPRNPYARVAGLAPLVILISALVITDTNRYVFGYHYDPHVASQFNYDLTLLNYQVRTDKQTTLVVAESEKPFYDAVAHFQRPGDSRLTVTLTQPSSGSFASTQAARDRISGTPTRIVVNSLSYNADRFYLYKNTSK